MPRPIDGDAFAKDLEIAADSLRVTWVMDRHEMFAKRDAYREIADRIRKAPTIDYEPVRHGEWGEYESPYGFPSLSGFPCSVCGMHQMDVRGLNYCPNCGAKMDGGKENDKP